MRVATVIFVCPKSKIRFQRERERKELRQFVRLHESNCRPGKCENDQNVFVLIKNSSQFRVILFQDGELIVGDFCETIRSVFREIKVMKGTAVE
jgi:hypothetical protein